MKTLKPNTPGNHTPFFVDNEVIVLTKNGIWLADGIEISHEPTRRLFAKSLIKGQNGYHLHIGRETKDIYVEDTAYFIHRIEGAPETGYKLWVNDETQESLDPTTLKYQPGRLTCKIKNGTRNGAGKNGTEKNGTEKATEEAKFLHSAYHDLLKELKQDSASYYLEFGAAEGCLRIDVAPAGP